MPASEATPADLPEDSPQSTADGCAIPSPSPRTAEPSIPPERPTSRMARRRELERTRVRRSIRTAGILALVMIFATASVGAVHVVDSGETLSEIAAEYGVSTTDLAAANNLTNPDLIVVGQTLTIPGTERTHTVQPGEFLAGIAATYDTSVDAIVDANTLHNPNLIVPGQILIIPGAGTAPGPAPLVHVVQRGESLASIAAKYGLTVEALASYNGMTSSSVIYVGTQLRLTPPTDAPYTPDAGSRIHVVAAGETLGGIAIRYGTTIDHLAAVNGIANPHRIRIGQRIEVPAAGFVCPVPGSTFFNDWGFPRSGGRFHEGNDMYAARGMPVVAPVSGTVRHVTGTIGGLQFWLDGDDGNLYIGTHLDSFVGSSGRVVAGQQIGTVGDSGNALGSRPHLHFEIMVGGHTNINPYPTIKKACG